MSALATQYLELPDIQIAYTECGSGPNLILLHGNSGSKRLFQEYQTQHFQEFHTYALDSRGHGQSRSCDKTLSIRQISQDVIGFCDQRGIQEAAVIGYSDGGNIALFLAHQRPDLFKKVMAVSPNYLVSGTTDDSLKLLQGVNSVFKFINTIGINTEKWLMRFALMLTDIGLSEADLRAIATNLRLLYAEKDMVKEDHILAIHELVPGSTVQKIPDCTHLSIMKAAAAIQDMRDYLLK